MAFNSFSLPFPVGFGVSSFSNVSLSEHVLDEEDAVEEGEE